MYEKKSSTFLGDALSWLMGTATTKDVNSIKMRVNQLLATQNNQQETLAHTISVLNITRYTTQVNRQHINIILDTVDRTHQDVTTLYNITSSLYNSLSYQQIMLHIHSILANLQDSLYYMREVTMHTMDYVDAATKEYFHLKYYQWKISERCYYTLRKCYL